MRNAKEASPSASSARGASAAEPALWLPQPDFDAIKAYFKGITLKDVMQLRLPLFLTGETVRGKTRVWRSRGMKCGDRREEVRLLKVLLTQATLAVVLGRFCFSYAWLLIMMQFTLSLYTLFRTRRAELRSHIDRQHIQQLAEEKAEEKKRANLQERSWSGSRKVADATALLGTKWEEIGTERPKTGQEISNQGLATALESKVEFGKTELDGFKVLNLTAECYIKVRDKYLRPAAVPVKGEAKYLQMLSLAGELYLHVIAGQLLAYQIGYYRMDTVLMLPLVELVIGVERFFPTFQRRCELRGYKKKVEWEEKFSSRIPDVKKQLFYEKMSVNPLEVQDEWFNLLLAQFWQVFGKGWVSEYVRGWIEIFTVQLGLVTEVCDFGDLPLQVRKLEGKKRTVFAGTQIKRDHPDDWIYDLDLHLELDTDELLIRLAYPVAGFNFPLYVDHMRLSGPFRVEFEFLELDERDARASNPTFPGLAGMKIYFTERPEIELTLWIGGVFDLVGIPLIGWIIQKLVVDNIVCHSLKLGPNFEGKIGMDIFGNAHPVAGAVAKTLALKARDRKRNAEADLDTSMSMACRISVKLASALNLAAGDFYCIFKYGGRDKVDMEKPPEGITHQTRAQKGIPQSQTVWSEKDDRPFEWTTNNDAEVLKVALMSRKRTGGDVQIGNREITLGDLRLKLGGLLVNRKAKVWECIMGEAGEIRVNLEVQFKAMADLPGIKVPLGTLLKDAQAIEYTPKSEDDAQYYEKNLPLQDVGGKLRVRLLKVDCLPSSCQHKQMIFTRVILGKQASYGNKLCENSSPRTPRASGEGATFYTKEMTKSQAKKLGLEAFDSVPKSGVGASIEREWTEAEGRFEFDISEKSQNDMLVFQVWRDDKLSKDEILGSTCLSIGDLSSQHNGALFKKAVFESALISTKGEIVVGHGNTTVLNFLAELVPDIQFKL